MMRESLAGFPRESFSVLFRQSLSGAELERMFEDDSTGSFEKLELRLKTPKRPNLLKSISKLTVVQQPDLMSKDEEEVKTKPESKEEEAGEEKSYLQDQKEEQKPDMPEVPESCPVLKEKEVSDNALEEVTLETVHPVQSTPEKPKDVKEDEIKSPESYTEEDFANMEIIEYEFEDSNMSIQDLSIFDKSLSLADLREETKQVEQKCCIFCNRTFSIVTLLINFHQRF
jgi:hypothetical protein